jgi:hypothetical protein
MGCPVYEAATTQARELQRYTISGVEWSVQLVLVRAYGHGGVVGAALNGSGSNSRGARSDRSDRGATGIQYDG